MHNDNNLGRKRREDNQGRPMCSNATNGGSTLSKKTNINLKSFGIRGGSRISRE